MKTGIIKNPGEDVVFTELDYYTVHKFVDYIKHLKKDLTHEQRVLLAGCNDNRDLPECDVYWDEPDEDSHGDLWTNLDADLTGVI